MDRRAFLTLLGLGAAGVACTRLPALPAPFEGVATGARASTSRLNVFLGGQEFVLGRRQRVPFGLVGADGLPVDAAEPEVWIGAEASPAGPFPARWHAFAEPDGATRGFYTAELPFPRDPDTAVLVTHAGDWGVAYTRARASFHVPGIGMRARAIRTPTTDDRRGVRHLCTREPACGLHAESLDDALASEGPVVLAIGSPRFCRSRTCGPVLEEILTVRERFPRARFVHAEPHRDDQGRLPAPVWTAWSLESEPWTFVIDERGIVAARFEGPVAADEIGAAMAALSRRG